MQNLSNLDVRNLQKATEERIGFLPDFPAESVGSFNVGFLFSRCSNFLVLLLHHLKTSYFVRIQEF